MLKIFKMKVVSKNTNKFVVVELEIHQNKEFKILKTEIVTPPKLQLSVQLL